MSSTLKWEIEYRKKNSLSDEMKVAFRDSMDVSFIHGVRLDSKDLEFLRGMNAAGMAEAQELINAIREWGSIVLNEEH